MTEHLHAYLADQEKIKLLFPVVAANILVRNFDNDDEVAIIDSDTDTILGSVGQAALRLLSHCTGQESVHAIINKEDEYSEADVLAFMLHLFDEKVLTFQLPDPL